jgi:hypothetical protein
LISLDVRNSGPVLMGGFFLRRSSTATIPVSDQDPRG